MFVNSKYKIQFKLSGDFSRNVGPETKVAVPAFFWTTMSQSKTFIHRSSSGDDSISGSTQKVLV